MTKIFVFFHQQPPIIMSLLLSPTVDDSQALQWSALAQDLAEIQDTLDGSSAQENSKHLPMLQEAFQDFKLSCYRIPIADTANIRAVVILNLVLQWYNITTRMYMMFSYESFENFMCTQHTTNKLEEAVAFVDDCTEVIAQQAVKWMRNHPSDDLVRTQGWALYTFAGAVDTVVERMSECLHTAHIPTTLEEIYLTTGIVEKYKQVKDY
jgi:hypothetical protein